MNKDARVIEFPRDLHERAEAAVQKEVPNLEQMSPKRIRDLVHDLMVSRTELELQNQALRQIGEEHSQKAAEAGSLLENYPDVIVRFDRDLRIQYANPAFERAVAFSEERALGNTPSELEIPKDLASATAEKVRYVFDTGQETTQEFEYAGAGGKRFYHVRFVPERYKDAVFVSVLATAHDITDLVETREKLRESEERFRTVSELITDYAYSFRVDPSCRLDVEWVYGAFEQITGYTPEDANIHTDWTLIIHPADQEIAQHRIETLLSGNEV
ncbi:MAG: PAS domain-containing protein, partial [Candidatus Latescibacterota bacterium]